MLWTRPMGPSPQTGVSGHVYSVEIGKQLVKDAVLQDLEEYTRVHEGRRSNIGRRMGAGGPAEVHRPG